MQAVLIVISLAWFAIVMAGTYRIHVLARIREFFPPGRAGQIQSIAVAGIVWGFAFNVGWLPVIFAAAA